MDSLVIDSNIVADYLKGSETAVLPQIWDHYKLLLSAVSVAELFAAKKSQEPEMKQKIDELLEKYFTIVPVDTEIAHRTAEILRELDIALANAIVAATAITKECPLVTFDLSIFDLVPDLKLVDL